MNGYSRTSDNEPGSSVALGPGSRLQVQAARGLLRRLPGLIAATEAHAAEAAHDGDTERLNHWLEMRQSWSLLGRQAERVLDDLVAE